LSGFGGVGLVGGGNGGTSGKFGSGMVGAGGSGMSGPGGVGLANGLTGTIMLLFDSTWSGKFVKQGQWLASFKPPGC